MLVTDVFACEDAYTQEPALIEQVVPTVQANDVWVELGVDGGLEV